MICQTYFLLLLCHVLVKSFPFNQLQINQFPKTNEIAYMKKFGYLDEFDGFEATYTTEAISDAIRNLQRYGGLRQTGIIDEQTKKLFTKRRCGVKDIIKLETRFKRYSIRHGWSKRNISYYISNWPEKLGRDLVEQEMRKAFDVWAKPGMLSFYQQNDDQADIKILFAQRDHGDQYQFDGRGGILAHAYFPTSGGDMHFDADEQWGKVVSDDDADDSTDFLTVAVHELGHALGLAHSDVTSSIMFPYYERNSDSYELDNDDLQALLKLYSDIPLALTMESERADSDELSTTSSSIDETQDVTDYYDLEETLPDICSGNYDTLARIRGELLVFQGEYVWRLKKRQVVESEYPIKWRNLFLGLPDNITKIDAAHEKRDGSIVLFSGRKYWLIQGDAHAVTPKSLLDFEIEELENGIDAIQFYEPNQKTYIYKGDVFWRFDGNQLTLDVGYPKNMTRWKGIPSNIGAVITWDEGKIMNSTYFFKGNNFWRFDNIKIEADCHYPLPTLPYWFGCPEDLNWLN